MMKIIREVSFLSLSFYQVLVNLCQRSTGNAVLLLAALLTILAVINSKQGSMWFLTKLQLVLKVSVKRTKILFGTTRRYAPEELDYSLLIFMCDS